MGFHLAEVGVLVPTPTLTYQQGGAHEYVNLFLHHLSVPVAFSAHEGNKIKANR